MIDSERRNIHRNRRSSKCFFAIMRQLDPPPNRVPLDVLAQQTYERMHRHRSADRSADNVSVVSSLGESFFYGVEDCPRDPPEISSNPNKKIVSHRSGLATECETESVQIQQQLCFASNETMATKERKRHSASVPHWVRWISILSLVLFLLAGILTSVALISNAKKSKRPSGNNQNMDAKAPTDYWVTRESAPINPAPSIQPSPKPVANPLSTADSLPPSSQPTERPSIAPTLTPSLGSKDKGNKEKD